MFQLASESPHLNKFKNCYPAPPQFAQNDPAEGKSPRQWYAAGPNSKPLVNEESLPGTVNRAQLIAMASDVTVETLPLCIAILAWGGMHGSNRDHLFRKPTAKWNTLADSVRNGGISREHAFARFSALASEGELTGVRPAYFTKLIYFLMPRNAQPLGYIMDQWVGSAVNVLLSSEMVKMNYALTWTREKRKDGHLRREVSGQVSDVNTSKDYEAFCRAIEAVAQDMGTSWTPEQTELALMSSGGVNAAAWRDYVRTERRKTVLFDHRSS